MIEIKEITPPKKVSGRSSLWVTFDYDEKKIETAKTVGQAYYHKKEHAWEFPLSQLRILLDSFTFLDDIELKLLPKEEEADDTSWRLRDDEKKLFRISPYPHQLDAIEFGVRKKKWLLLDSMGLGKTSEIIWTAETLKRRGLIKHCLIICGVDSLRQNWKKEIGKFSTESCLVLGEKVSKKGNISYATISERCSQLKNKIDEFFVIVNSATLRSDEFVNAFKKSQNSFGMIAVDECHCFATKSSLQGGNLLKLKAEYEIAATGTPITNSPISIYLPLSWIDVDHSTLTGYKSLYCEFGGFKDSQVIGYKNLDLLKDEIDHNSLRRTLDQVRDDMPKKVITTELIEMDDRHKKFYEAVRNGVKEEVDKVELNTSNLLALTTRLRQASTDPGILTSEEVESSKISRAVELIETLVSQKEKVVVLSSFKEPVYRLAKKLEKYRPLINTGDQSDADVFNNMDKFQNDPNYLIFIGTHSKCGTGITLNAASYMICLDELWTAAKNNQSFDRIYRVNNTRPAFITVLICKGTIDERVHDVSARKQELSDYMIDGKEGTISQSLRNEMLSVLRDL